MTDIRTTSIAIEVIRSETGGAPPSPGGGAKPVVCVIAS